MMIEKIKRSLPLILFLVVISVSIIGATLTSFVPEVPPPHGNFPPPDYDSGWLEYAQGQIRTLIHNLSGKELLVSSIAKQQITSYNNSVAYGYWKMDEDAGTIVSDSSSTNYDGNTTNMSLSNWVTGKCNSALYFNRSKEQFVDFGDIAIFTRWDDFSIESWFKTTYTSTQHITGKMYGTGNLRGYEQLMAGTGQLRFLIISDYTAVPRSYIHVRTPLGYNDGQWHHFVTTYDGSSTAAGVKMYVDSVYIPNDIVADNLVGSSSSGAIYDIGSRDGVTHFFNGTIDEVIVYEKVLSQAKVIERYNGGAGLCGGVEPPIVSNSTNQKYDGDVENGYYVNEMANNTIKIGRGASSDFAGMIRTRIWGW